MNTTKQIRIMIAEDHELYLDALLKIINKNSSIEVVATASNGADLIEKLKTNIVDLVLLDFRMPVMDGMETAEVIKEKYPDVKIVMLTMHNRTSIIKKMIKIGINGYILKNSYINEILNAITKVYNGELYYGEEVKDNLIEDIIENNDSANVSISSIEKRILSLICAGNSDLQISEQLNMDIKIVDLFVSKLYTYSNTNTRQALIRYAFEANLIDI